MLKLYIKEKDNKRKYHSFCAYILVRFSCSVKNSAAQGYRDGKWKCKCKCKKANKHRCKATSINL